MTEFNNSPIPEKLVNSKKVLRVFNEFGKEPEDVLSYFFSGSESKHNNKIIQIFQSNGFEIANGEFNENNPWEIGISSDEETTQRDRDLEIAQKVGIEMPKTFSPSEVIHISSPVVAKIPDADRGEQKYLLETTDQKVKFISWALLNQEISRLPSDKESQGVILNRIFEKVSKGIFKDQNVKKRGCLDGWVFEDFINTPGDFNTSLRVVADAFANLHYAQITRSQQPKNSELLINTKIQNLELEKPWSYGFQLSTLLTHPDSPFFLASKNFMSNIAQGGKRILLDGNPITDPEDRELLIKLGMDPDQPSLSEDLQKKSKEIGKLCRKHYPHIGIDYLIRNNDKKPLLLEINKGPHLYATALGLPENTKPEDCELELVKRIILKLNKTSSP